MKKFKLLLTLTFLTIMIMAGYISCRKSDIPSSTIPSTETKFFTSHRSADVMEKTIVDFLIKENGKNQFIEKTVNQIGFPFWDKIIKKSKTSSNVVKTSMSIENKPFGVVTEPCDVFYIPFVRDSQNYVNASMVITATSTDTSISYLCDWQYKSKPHGSVNDMSSAENYATFFMYLDRNTLGNNQFQIIDTLLFSKMNTKAGNRVVGFANKSSLNILQRKVFATEICVDFYVCNWPTYCGDNCDYLNCPANPSCYLVQSYCSTYDPTAGSTYGINSAIPGTIVTGSGGSGGSTPPIPCGINIPSIQSEQKNLTSFNTPCSSTPGWTPVSKNGTVVTEAKETETMSPNAIDQDLINSLFTDYISPKPRPLFATMIANSLPPATATYTWQNISNKIGGEVTQQLISNNNTCATRVSYALNYSNSPIPAFSASFTGMDQKNYIVGATTMLAYLIKAYGTDPINTVHLASTTALPLTATYIQSQLKGKQGIYVIIPIESSPAGFNASGHVDLLASNGTFASGHTYYYCTGGVKEVYLFILN